MNPQKIPKKKIVHLPHDKKFKRFLHCLYSFIFSGKNNQTIDKEAINTYKEAFNVEVLQIQIWSDMSPDPKFPVSENDKIWYFIQNRKLTHL